MKHLVRFVAAVSSFFVLAGGTDVAASPSAASAGVQVKALCDSSVAKSKAGDVAGAKADIDQAIVNVAQIPLDSHLDSSGRMPEKTELAHLLDSSSFEDPKIQRNADIVVSAMGSVCAGNIAQARGRLATLPLEAPNYVCVHLAAIEMYAIMGDFENARKWMGILEKKWPCDVARYRVLVGDSQNSDEDFRRETGRIKSSGDAFSVAFMYLQLAQMRIVTGDFAGANSDISSAREVIKIAGLQKDASIAPLLSEVERDLKRFQSNPTLCWGNPANPRRVAMTQVSKARCELALAQAKAGDMGAAKETLYFIIDEPDKIATEKAIAQAGAAFLQSGNVAKGIETLVVIPSAKQATAAQIRETIKTWLDIKNAKLAEILAKLLPQEKEALKTKLELAILDCATQADVAKTLSIAAAQNGQGDPSALVELSNNYLNLQNVLKAVYKSLSEE